VQRFIRGTSLGVVLVCSFSAVTALADGGPTIGGAPTIAYGQPNFGNLTNVAPDSNGCQREFWLLPVIAKDSVTITWSALYSDTAVSVYPVGTKDSSWPKAKAVADASSNSTGAGHVSFAAARTGDMVVMFVDQNPSASAACANPGPYNFSASVVHKMIMSLRGTRKVKGPVTHTTFALRIYNPDGVRIDPPGLMYDGDIRTREYEPAGVGFQRWPLTFTVHWNYQLWVPCVFPRGCVRNRVSDRNLKLGHSLGMVRA